MKRPIFVVSFALASAFITTPAHAGDPVTLSCTELPAPNVALVPTSANPLFKEPSRQVNASLANMKAHPIKHTVFGVRCQIGGDGYQPQSWREACHVVSMSYGRWIPNTRNSTRALIWNPVNCKDSLYFRMQ